MGKGLFPILLTLIIAALVFGLWFAAVQRGFFLTKTADDISICRVSSDTLQLTWKNQAYSITGWYTERHDDDILHVDVNIIKRSGNNIMVLVIDTINVNYLEIYGKAISVNEIPDCK